MDYVFKPAASVSVRVCGGGLFPVRRIFCVGRNYAEHVREMGNDPKETPPTFFTKPADAAVASGSFIPYAQATENLHYEGELVVALKAGGHDIRSPEAATDLIYGYAAGCDLTRRDHQLQAKTTGTPWDTAKGFDNAAPIGDILRSEDFSNVESAQLITRINGEERQNAPLWSMIWAVPEIIMALSRLFELKPGDLIYTGTPEGVAPLKVGDKVEVEISSLPVLTFTISEPL